MIDLQGLEKKFYIQKKEPGLKASIKSLFWRVSTESMALKPLCLKIDQGEFIGLLGSNGAGKTTLVKICTGIIKPTGGSARVLGFDPWERDNEFRRSISLIMGQKAQLWWDLPAADCFQLLKVIYKIDEHSFKLRMDELVSLLDLGKIMNTQIRRLSLGERMKMELVAALLHQPKVIFLDEPTIGLDIASQRALRDFIRRYHETYKPTIVLTSHYIEDIESLCKRIIVLREGSKVYDGSLESLVKRYGAQKTLSMQIDIEKINLNFASLSDFDERIDPTWISSFSFKDGVLQIIADREMVSKLAAILLERLPVKDLSVADADVATIIDKLQTGKH